MKPSRCLAILVLALAALYGPWSAPSLAQETLRGITISTHTSGREWGWDVMGPTMDQLQAVGADWAATHPYARIEADGTVRFRPIDPADPPAHLIRPIAEAHARGMKILIKPHLGYWGSPFRWRGDIGFDTPEAWDRFFTSYREWIVDVAVACKDADGFVVGTELDLTLEHVQEWRAIIAEIRERTDLALTYAANWSEYQRVEFWQDLDVIGIQAYFPVAREEGADRAAVDAGWRRVMEELREYSQKHNRAVVFTELGYNRSFEAPVRPWSYRVDGPEAESIQAACLSSALRAIEAEPVVLGSFLWKWFPEPRPVGRNFQLATPRLRQAIAEVWLQENTLTSPPSTRSR